MKGRCNLYIEKIEYVCIFWQEEKHLTIFKTIILCLVCIKFKGCKKVKGQPRDKWTSFYKEKEQKCKDWIVRGDKTRTDLKISSILILSQKNTENMNACNMFLQS